MFSRHQYNCCLVLTIYVSWSLLGNGTRHFIISLEHHSCSNGKVLVVVFQLLSYLTLCNPVACSMPGFLSFTVSQSLIKLSCPLDILLKTSFTLSGQCFYPLSKHSKHCDVPMTWIPHQERLSALVLSVVRYSLQLSDPSGFALSAEICFTQEASPHPVMDQCEYKGLDNSAQLGTAVKRAILVPEIPVAQPDLSLGLHHRLFLSAILLPTPADLPQVLIARALFNDTLLTKLHLRICFLRNLL